jgi:hypothetical protein
MLTYVIGIIIEIVFHVIVSVRDDNTERDFKVVYENMNWMKLAQDKEKWCTLVNTVMKLWVS